MIPPVLWVVEMAVGDHWEPCEDDFAHLTEDDGYLEMAKYEYLHPSERYRVVPYVRRDER